MAGQSCQNTQDRYNPLHEVYFGPVVPSWVHWSLDVQSGAHPSECSQFPTGSHYLVSAGNNDNNKTHYIFMIILNIFVWQHLKTDDIKTDITIMAMYKFWKSNNSEKLKYKQLLHN